eukprot:CAMPEP_0171648938 /NCGR_PEP_ID=MMETSP0990-20121206/36457_1 /TAXON_ID=483369 /ORGANISM="non described non described, Strain CCMP2098" /LENGTH=91 /DNA_ID=CAMNT_0012226663 /DNA_START=148 /DNA_END=423 /DNA_ORIENTATION=+
MIVTLRVRQETVFSTTAKRQWTALVACANSTAAKILPALGEHAAFMKARTPLAKEEGVTFTNPSTLYSMDTAAGACATSMENRTPRHSRTD